MSPHLKDGTSTAGIMWSVAAALLPQLALAAWVCGPRVRVVAGVSVGSAVRAEWAGRRAMGRDNSVADGSAALTGLLLAYVLPPGASLDLPFWGAVFSVIIAKQLFGGLGFNFFNPALMGRAFLAVGFPVAMTTAWIMPHYPDFLASLAGPDAVATATPLYVLKHAGYAEFAREYGGARGLASFVLGFRPGCIGETSPLLLLLGGGYLLWRRIITWHIPAAMLGATALLVWVFGPEGWFTGPVLAHLLSGGLVLGAFFMATDYVTSPSRPAAKLVFGAGCGALTVLIRLKGGYPEGVCYAILLMNCLSPVLDDWIRPKRFAPPLTCEPGKAK